MELEKECPKAPIVFPQISIVCGIMQTLMFLFFHSKQGVTIWLPIINLLGFFACCTDLIVLHLFKKSNSDFKTFRFVFLLDLLNGFFFAAAITFIPPIFTTQENMWIYTEHKVECSVAALILVFYSLLREARSSIKKIQLTRARLLFSGVGLAGNKIIGSPSALPSLIIIVVIAISYATSRTIGRIDLYLLVIFFGSIFVAAQVLASCLAAVDQLFVRGGADN
jgi:hypothetical protein